MNDNLDDLKTFLREWTDSKEIDFPFIDVVKIGREYFLTNEATKKIVEQIKLEPASVGVFLGQKKKYFEPSMALIEMIANITDKKVQTDFNSAWLFACGRDLFENNVKEMVRNNHKVIVLNEKKEVFGYAIKTRDRQNEIFKNLLDIGFYLRREKN